jgi:hypothetical protein
MQCTGKPQRIKSISPISDLMGVTQGCLRSAISAISAIFPQFSSNLPQFLQISAISRNFFLGGYHNFRPWEYLIPQSLEGVQNHNLWFKIHIFFFALNILFLTPNTWSYIFCWVLALFWLAIFLAPFSLSTVTETEIFLSRPQLPKPKATVFRNFGVVWLQFALGFALLTCTPIYATFGIEFSKQEPCH